MSLLHYPTPACGVNLHSNAHVARGSRNRAYICTVTVPVNDTVQHLTTVRQHPLLSTSSTNGYLAGRLLSSDLGPDSLGAMGRGHQAQRLAVSKVRVILLVP